MTNDSGDRYHIYLADGRLFKTTNLSSLAATYAAIGGPDGEPFRVVDTERD